MGYTEMPQIGHTSKIFRSINAIVTNKKMTPYDFSDLQLTGKFENRPKVFNLLWLFF